MLRATLSGTHIKKSRKFHNKCTAALMCTGSCDTLLDNLNKLIKQNEKQSATTQERYEDEESEQEQ